MFGCDKGVCWLSPLRPAIKIGGACGEKFFYAGRWPIKKKVWPNRIWMKAIKINLKKYNILKNVANNRAKWRNKVELKLR